MKKFFALLLALVMALSLVACGDKAPADNGGEETPDVKDYSGYTIRIYSNSNSTERTTWLVNAAKDAGYEFVLPSMVLDNCIENEYVDNIENGVA